MIGRDRQEDKTKRKEKPIKKSQSREKNQVSIEYAGETKNNDNGTFLKEQNLQHDQ